MAELATATATAVVSKAAETVTETVCEFGCRQINYVFKYRSYMKKLKEQAEKLKSRRKVMEVQVKLAERQGEEIIDEVTKWLKSVEEFMERVAKLVDDEDKAKKRCFKGLCPDLIKRYRLSKEAEEVEEAGANALEKGDFSRISHPPLLRRTESIFVGKDYEHFDSRESNFQEIMDALKDSTVNMIGVHGMGGVGKTTLVKKVAWKAKEDKLFDEVVIAEVTQTPDLKKIQADIAGQLGMVFRDQESPFGRADQLRQRLKKSKRILVIVDNIWKKLDLKDVGIPLSYDNKGSMTEHRNESNDEQERCAILLTARMLAVLNQMKTQKNISVEPLATNDARSFFWKIVGDLSEKCSIAAEVVEKCAGSPLAITTIANALKGKGDHVWKDALLQLKNYNHRCVPEMDNTLHSTIVLSYKLLNSEEAQSLLLLCALFDGGHISWLLIRAMGLGLFEHVNSINDGRNRIKSLIDYLQDSCLLLKGIDKETVKMHDVIHTVIVSIAREKCMFAIRDFKGIKEILMERRSSYKDSIAISVSSGDIHELPERLEFPKLKSFIYNNIKDLRSKIPDLFFEEVKELKVLELKGVHLLPPPPSFVCLTNLNALCLMNCSLGDITMIGELRNLVFLGLLYCDLEKVPASFKQLMGLKVLVLNDCPKLKVIPPNVIASLSQLEELYIYNSFDRWEVEGQNNASLAELNALPELNTLRIHIPNVQMIQQDFIPVKLEKYDVHIGDVWDWSYAYEPSRTLKLKFNGRPHMRHGIEILMEKAKYLYLDQLDGVKDMPWELDREGFPELKHLSVQNSSEILYVVNSMEYTHPSDAFPILESIFLTNLSDMEKICCRLDNAKSFSQLRIIKVADCDKLRYLFSSSMAKNILLLEEINVTNCKTLKEIFGEESEDHADENKKVCKIGFKQLHSVVLQGLPQLIRFGLEVALPRLENLKLSSIKIENIWVDLLQPTSSYIQCLKSLTVEECNGLKFLFSSSMVKSFLQLQKLVICNCKSMEAVIFESEELEGADKIIQMNFPKLFYLKLQGLPKLTRFGIGNLVQFPALNELHIESCSSLKTFFPNSSSVEVSLENILTTNIEPLFDDKVDLSGLEKLILLHLDNLQLIWHNQLRGDSFCKLKEVRVEFCENLVTIVPSNSTQGFLTFQNLEILTVGNCWNIKSLFPVSIAIGLLQLKTLELISCGLEIIVGEQEVDGTPEFLFPQLTRLYLDNLPELKHFYMGSYTAEWPMLKELLVYKCGKIKVYALDGESQLAPFSFEKVVPNLENLGLNADSITSSCLDHIPARRFGKLKFLRLESFDDYSVGFQFNLLKKLQNLESLILFDCTFQELLPYEGCTRKENSQMKTFLQNLEALIIDRCHCLTSLMSSSYIYFKNIKHLEVNRCNGLANILACSAAKTLAQITTIRIRECELVTEVIATESEIETIEEEIVFNQLEMLELHCLNSLTCFCSANYAFRFPCLEQVIVSQCPNLKIFSNGGLSTPKLEKVQLTEIIDAKYIWKGDLNSIIQHMCGICMS
ncbi:probable disease resistance protein At4g27220 [Mangifera indica]|uniref:probable disease resistance protein At4g27220 n=1 Tax=Mangifera indica TaxID=29780 RepID=UPI001CFAC791|nr:probable disease resistance protein At4g27220 [Mangifera indica]